MASAGTSDGRRLRTGDRALIAIGAVTLLAAAAGAAWWSLGGDTGDGAVVVSQTREGLRRVDPLDVDAEFTVETSEGWNTVRISEGEVDVVEADCSNQVCVKHDPVSRAGEQIVCLPHGLVIEVADDADDVPSLLG